MSAVQQQCPDCKNEFIQPFRCVTCGAQRLYDATVATLQQQNDALRAQLDAARAATGTSSEHLYSRQQVFQPRRVTMRTINEHKVNPANDMIEITVTDEPGSGGANHRYELKVGAETTHLDFQNGPIAEVGVNGLTQEALIAVVVDRLRAFQAGPFACRENSIALTKLEEAQHWLHHRTRARMARGVEGTNSK